MNLPKITEIDKEPCETCVRMKGCEAECFLFEHWVSTGRTMKTILAMLNEVYTRDNHKV